MLEAREEDESRQRAWPGRRGDGRGPYMLPCPSSVSGAPCKCKAAAAEIAWSRDEGIKGAAVTRARRRRGFRPRA